MVPRIVYSALFGAMGFSSFEQIRGILAKSVITRKVDNVSITNDATHDRDDDNDTSNEEKGSRKKNKKKKSCQ